MGVPIEEAEGYNRDFESGRTLVTVNDTGARGAAVPLAIGDLASPLGQRGLIVIVQLRPLA